MRLVNGAITGGVLGLLGVMTLSGGCSSTTPHADGGAGVGGRGQGGGSGAGIAGADGGGGQLDGGSCRAQGQACSDTQPCCVPLLCTGTCSVGIVAVDAGLSVDASDASGDARPYICPRLRSLVLSDPMVISGPVAGGQTVSIQLTLTDTDPNGFVSYPEAFLTSSTPGVTFPADQAGPPGAYIDGSMTKPITFFVKLAASISSGTLVQTVGRAARDARGRGARGSGELARRVRGPASPIDPPDPIDAIVFRMEQMGLTRADLVPIIGSRARVSEVLNRCGPPDPTPPHSISQVS